MTAEQLAGILSAATPLIFAALGETLSERAGVINLSLDGTILLAAMIGFAVGFHTDSVLLAILAAALTGSLVSLVLAWLSLTLRQSQTAVGFVLALLATDLSSFLGNPYVQQRGASIPPAPIPFLRSIPVLGPLFFNHDVLIYFSFLLIPLLWWFLFHTRAGLLLRALGERPEAVFARGHNVIAMRYAYVLLGGALVGIAGAAYSLDIKQGWSYRHTAGAGWIALAIVIFGGWEPWRVALGCYLFGFLQTLGNLLQSQVSQVPTQIFTVAPFAIMIFVLAVVNTSGNPALLQRIDLLPPRIRGPLRRILVRIAAAPPAALGQTFVQP